MENEWGWIEEITLTYVVVRIWDKRRLIVPSTQVIEKPFQNWTRSSSDILGTVFLHTDYRMPVEELRAELTRILENTPLWDGKVNVLQVTNLTDKTMELRALVSAKNSPTALGPQGACEGEIGYLPSGEFSRTFAKEQDYAHRNERQMNALIVDDEEDIGLMVSRFLRKEGLQVSYADRINMAKEIISEKVL